MAPLLTETYLALLQLLRDVRFVLEMHANVILYLIPVFLICAWLQALHARPPHARSWPYTQSISLIVGVFIHELLHLLVGVLTYAKPVAMSIIPRHIEKGYYELGHVRLQNIRWFNGVFVAWRPCLDSLALLFSFTGAHEPDGFSHGGISSLGMFSRKSP